MNKFTIERRVSQLRAMDDFVRSCNDEELIFVWLTYGVPDGWDESDLIEIASDEEMFTDCVKAFKAIVKNDDAY